MTRRKQANLTRSVVPRVGDILDRQRFKNFVGREHEMNFLMRFTTGSMPLVAYIYGIGGIGKTTLINTFLAQATKKHIGALRIDCRLATASQEGFLELLGTAMGTKKFDLDTVIKALHKLGRRAVLAIDNYEALYFLDPWLRQVFVPALADNIRLIIVSRHKPAAAWHVAPEWQGLFHSQSLAPLSHEESMMVMKQAGLTADAAGRVSRFVGGHPLALKLAMAALLERPGLDLGPEATQDIVHQLTSIYLGDIRDPWLRNAIFASSIVRRITRSLLAAMLPGAREDIYDHLPDAPIIEKRADGLMVHDAVRDHIAASFRAGDPMSYRAYRLAAWKQLSHEFFSAPSADMWRYTADSLYFVENPLIREAFFPSKTDPLMVERAQSRDWPEIRQILRKHENKDTQDLMAFWWSNWPGAFRVVRDDVGKVLGFYCMLDEASVDAGLLEQDPLIARWLRHLRDDKIIPGQTACFVRLWLSRDEGAEPSESQAACWIDIARAGMEFGPRLRRMYVILVAKVHYTPVQLKLGFRLVPECQVTIGDSIHETMMLDFGPGSVRGWLSEFVAHELGIENNEILDIAARELMVGGERIGLTKLEFELIHYLFQNKGRAISRDQLLDEVWGLSYHGGSNVVDVVIRSLRKKLGTSATMLETIRGTGYRFTAS